MNSISFKDYLPKELNVEVEVRKVGTLGSYEARMSIKQDDNSIFIRVTDGSRKSALNTLKGIWKDASKTIDSLVDKSINMVSIMESME